MRALRLSPLLSLFVLACAPDYKVEGEVQDTGVPSGADADSGGDSATDDSEAFLDEVWAGATLRVLAPASGDFLPLGEPADFEAVVYDAAGNPTDFTDITWGSDIDGAWLPTGKVFEDATLNVGTHALTATAKLPSGDTLAYTIGGVLVQHEDTGTYVGTLQIDATIEYDGQAFTVTCIGALTMVVDQTGEVVEGDSTCLLSLSGFDLELEYALNLENDEGTLTGEAAAVVWGYELPSEFTGEVGEGLIGGGFETEIIGTPLVGTVEVERITRTVSSGE